MEPAMRSTLDTASTWRPSITGLTMFAVVKNTAGGESTQGWFGNGSGKVAFGANVKRRV